MPDEKEIKEEVKNVEATEAGEGEILKEANKDTIEEIQEFQEKKEELKKEKATKPKEPKAKRSYDLNKLNTFKDKLVKDFSLEATTNQRQRTYLKHNGKTIIRLIPRKRVWYGLKRYDHAMKRIMYYTIESEKDEEDHYKFVKFFIKNLSEKQDKPTEEA